MPDQKFGGEPGHRRGGGFFILMADAGMIPRTLRTLAAFVEGGAKLTAATVMASDLRASAALVLAGLVADGTTKVTRIYHMDRGYERFEQKLSAIGGRIERVSDGE